MNGIGAEVSLYSAVTLEPHYLTDVVVGLLWGATGSGSFCGRDVRRLLRLRPGNPHRFSHRASRN